MIIKFTAVEDGKTVYTAARRELKVSSSLLRRLKAADAIKVNGEKAFTNRVLAAGDVLTLDISAAETTGGVVPEQGELEIIWETCDYLAVNKPCGLIVHPTHSRYKGTLANFVAGYLPDGVCHVVNRLDRDTSGVVLFAKSAYHKDIASQALSETGEKEYTALVMGCPSPACGTVNVPIKRLSPDSMLRAALPDGQAALTRYETLCTSGDVSLLRIYLETGRTHQIRVHMLHIGCPLLGDALYRTDDSDHASESHGITAQALHARRLSFIPPFCGERVDISAPLRRDDIKKALIMLKMTCSDY